MDYEESTKKENDEEEDVPWLTKDSNNEDNKKKSLEVSMNEDFFITSEIHHTFTLKSKGTIDCQYSADGKYCAVALLRTGAIDIFNDQHKPVYNIKTKQGGIRSIKWKPLKHTKSTSCKYILVVAGNDGSVSFWHVTSNKKISEIKGNVPINTLDYSNKKDYIAIGCNDYGIRLYNGSNKKIIAELDINRGLCLGHQNRVSCVKFDNHNENILYSASWDRNIIVWDIRSKNQCTSFLCGEIYYDSLDSIGHQLIVGCSPSISTDKLIQIYDIRKYNNLNYINQKDFLCDPIFSIYNLKCITNNEFIISGNNGIRHCILNNKDNKLSVSPSLSDLKDIFTFSKYNDKIAITGIDKSIENKNDDNLNNLNLLSNKKIGDDDKVVSYPCVYESRSFSITSFKGADSSL